MIAKLGVNVMFNMVGKGNSIGMIGGRRSGKNLGRVTHRPAEVQDFDDFSIVLLF